MRFYLFELKCVLFGMQLARPEASRRFTNGICYVTGLFEGDILIDEDTERYLTGGDIMSRDAVVSPILYWPKGIVYYMFDNKLGGLFRVEMSCYGSIHLVVEAHEHPPNICYVILFWHLTHRARIFLAEYC